ncbi:MAG: hypothetical protein L6R41_000792 [Letrouitia leprolyta]|nr:MAG: hypothetical protein L6R41_000792 [Letrouitia leprolyta]
MKSFTLSVAAAIVALTTAVPLEKRVLVIETVTDVVVATVQSTTTIWMNPHASAHPAHVAQHAHHQAHKAPAPAPVPAPAPAVPQSPPESPSPLAVINKQTAPVPAATPIPTSKPAPVVQQPAKQAAPVAQPAAPVYQAPSSPAPAPVPKAPSPPAAPKAAAPIRQPTSDFGSTAECGQVNGVCSGDITFYDTGLGACGWTNDGTTEKVFALAHGMMGEQSNGNPFCGRQAEISLDGKTATGKLVDKCGGCEGQSIDLSHALFQELASESLGRISDVKWHFID